MQAADWTLVAVLAVPHALYAFIWWLPKVFIAICLGDPVQQFYRLAASLKVIQFAAFYHWATLSGPLDLLSIPPARWALALLLGVLGQILNAGIYAAIGKKGVYYGFKLGHKVPWVKGFPFSLGIKHPQYVGASLTVWALVTLLWDPTGRPTLLPVGFAWTGLYVITAIIEDYF